MAEIRYTRDHEYIRLEADNVAAVGITDHAQSQLGDIVFVELPATGRAVKAGEETAVVESVKAASEIFAPASGTVLEINDALAENPGTVNEDPLGQGWFFKLTLSDTSELGKLMDEAAYTAYLQEIA